MDEKRAWQVIGANIPELSKLMLTIPQGSSVEVYCNVSGTKLSFGHPDGTANLRLCSVTAPNLEFSYDIHKEGGKYYTGDGDEILGDRLPGLLASYIMGMRDGGAEWGWEFKL